ncbi:Isochorismatase-like [Lasallia pustulata]|uniref:Isochorismatase-like n=1 Tax=Lasallia pustulata TaxID=136370 RepID=A0A1W5D1Q0_9LECA|nr:Isochorismatase-like [Lasallia pustulata]
MATALLIIDMQNFFLSMTDTCLANILNLISHFQTRSLPRIFTQHGHTAAELEPPFSNQLVRKWGPSGSIAAGSSDWELLPEMKKAAAQQGAATLVGKNTYDAFINTDLEQMLRERGVQRVVVCGVMTDCCCDTTARAAFNRGFETWMVGDACGTASKQQHESGLKGFGYGFGEVVTTEAVMKRVR